MLGFVVGGIGLCSDTDLKCSLRKSKKIVSGKARKSNLVCLSSSTATHAQHHESSSSELSSRLTKKSANHTSASSTTPRRAGFVGALFLLSTFLWAAPIFTLMLLAHPFVLLFDYKRRRFHDMLCLLWANLTMACSFCIPRIIGKENIPEPGQVVIYAANHQSYADIFSFAALRRATKFVSKSEILKIPTIGWAIALGKHVALRRGDRRGQVMAYREMIQSIKDGNSLAIFPEGTRSKTGRMKRFHSGAFKASVTTGAPVVPITIVGTRELMPPDSYIPVAYPKNGISVIVHPQVDPTGKTDEEMSALVFQAIESGLPEEFRTTSEVL